MEEFLLEVNGRLIRIVIEDVRGSDGCVPTLICSAAPFAQVLPLNPGSAQGYQGFPGMPRALRERGDEALEELRIDLSQLSSGTIPFSLEQFAEHATGALASGSREVRLTPEAAGEWGAPSVGV